MAAYMGKAGKVTIGTNKVALVDSWTLNTIIDTVETTAYGSTFKDRTSTLKDWNGSFTLTLDRSDTYQAQLLAQFEGATAIAAVAFRFYTAGATYWGGNALLTGMPIQSKVGDKVSVTCNFVGSGALSYT